jgi:hypothetical protein
VNTLIHTVQGFKVVAADIKACEHLINEYFPMTLITDWRDVSNHPAAQATYQHQSESLL